MHHLLFIFSMLLAFTAHAQALRTLFKEPPVAKVYLEMRRQESKCELLGHQYWDQARMAGTANAGDQYTANARCLAEATEAVTPLMPAAMKHLEARTEARNALKAWYVAWKAYMEASLPGGNESKKDFEARIAAPKQRFDAAQASLDLELALTQ